MKIYWCDREGNFPPPDAVFSWTPFFPDVEIPLSNPVIRIEQLPAAAKSVKILKRRYLPQKGEWVNAVRSILDATIDKVVLARCCILECESPPDPFAIVSTLKERAQGATLFCFAEGEEAFLGATPERLFLRKGNQLMSEALAGTRRRGKTPIEDAALAEELLGDAKELREFALVQDYLQEHLSRLCFESLKGSPLHVRKAQYVQHLCTSFTGTLKPVSDLEIVNAIHPTPAVCGAPKQLALEWIRRLEPFDRGLYGGTVGWSTEDAAEWAVAIRCCLIRGREVRLYTGAGIVAGSDPEEEWKELNLKMALYKGIFL